MRKKFYKIAATMMAVVTALSPMTALAANETQELGRDATSGEAEVVYDTAGEQTFTIVIPKKIILGSDKTAEYTVTVKGDVAQGSKVKVEPRDDVNDTEGINFIMTAEKSGDSKNVDVTQADVYWDYADIVANDHEGTAKPGDIDGSELTLGIWSGDLTFLINFEDEYFEENHKHNYTEEITKEPTCTEAGVKTYTCNCGDTYTEEILATGHDLNDENICTECDLSVAPEGDIKNWQYTLNDTDNTVTLIHYIGKETNVRVYSSYLKDGKTYETQIADSTPITTDDTEVMDISGQALFKDCISVKSISFDKIDTSNVTDMNRMFFQCSSLTSLDLRGLDTSNVTNMRYMFSYCTSLESLDLSNFDTSSVTNMGYMFAFDMNLVSLDVSGFNTSNVTDMSRMFMVCLNLKSLDLSCFDTSKVTNMREMFVQCQALTSLNVSSFDTSNVTNMNNMFDNDYSIASLDLSSFDTHKTTGMKTMFGGCSSLKSILVDKNKWDTSKADTYNMFNDCGTNQVTYK